MKYDWFQLETDAMRTVQFFSTATSRGESLPPASITAEWKTLPLEFLEFVQRYGTTKLFRGDGPALGLCYDMYIYFPPLASTDFRGTTFCRWGITGNSALAFRVDRDTGGCEPHVFVWPHRGAPRSTGLAFSEWLAARFDARKRRYGKRRWAALERGPEPWSAEELKIIEARRLFRWDLMESGSTSRPVFRITNGSARCLSHITIEYEAKVPSLIRGVLHGGLVFDVAGLPPGQTAEFAEELVYHGRADFDGPVRYFDAPIWSPAERSYLLEFEPVQASRD